MTLRKPKPKKRKLTSKQIRNKALKNTSKMPSDGPAIPKYSPAPVLTLCGQLEDSVMLLENRISNVIAKFNSLM